MEYSYSYILKNSINREKTDLRLHKENIKNAVNKIFDKKLIKVYVYKNNFEYSLSSEADGIELRNLGKEIVKIDKDLSLLKKDYGYSTQLFIRNRYDILIKNECEEAIAIVEIKCMKKFNNNSAIKIKNDILNKVVSNTVKYIFIFNNDNGYVWYKDPQKAFDVNYSLEINMKHIINKYVEKLNFGLLNHNNLELIYSQWFNDIINSFDKNDSINKDLNKIDFLKNTIDCKVLVEEMQ